MNPEDFERLIAGDPSAFGDVYDRYARLIRSICFDSTKNLSQAEDLTQESFLRAYERIGQLKQPTRLGGWLAAIARRACYDWHRRRRRDKHLFFDDLSDVATPIQTTNDRGEIDILRLAICDLPEKERLALHMHYLCQQPAEVAREVLGMSSSGFYKLVDRARRRLAARMNSRGVRP